MKQSARRILKANGNFNSKKLKGPAFPLTSARRSKRGSTHTAGHAHQTVRITRHPRKPSGTSGSQGEPRCGPYTPADACRRPHARTLVRWRAGRVAVLDVHLLANTHVPFLSGEVRPGQERLRGRWGVRLARPPSRTSARASCAAHLAPPGHGGEPWPSGRTCTPHAASHRAVRCGVALSRPAVMGARPSPDKAPETAQAPRQEAGAADSRHRTQRGWVCFSTAYPTAGGRAVYVRPNPEAQSLVSDMPPAPPSQVQRGGITGQLFSIVVLLNVLF